MASGKIISYRSSDKSQKLRPSSGIPFLKTLSCAPESCLFIYSIVILITVLVLNSACHRVSGRRIPIDANDTGICCDQPILWSNFGIDAHTMRKQRILSFQCLNKVGNVPRSTSHSTATHSLYMAKPPFHTHTRTHAQENYTRRRCQPQLNRLVGVVGILGPWLALPAEPLTKGLVLHCSPAATHQVDMPVQHTEPRSDFRGTKIHEPR
jgi:hypothetical protein